MSEPADDDSFEGEDAEVFKLIHSRYQSNEFPAVQPQEGAEEDLSAAIALRDKVTEDQHMRIQSYVEEKFAEYKDLLPTSDEPEWIIKARWARDTYYVHVKNLFADM